MFKWRKKIINIIILAILIVGLCFLGVNGNGQSGEINYNIPASTIRDAIEDEVPPEIEESTKKGGTNIPLPEPEPEKTNLEVILIDNINGNRIKMTNCILVLAGEMRIAEDIFTYNNSFIFGDMYKITVLVELKNDEKILKEKGE